MGKEAAYYDQAENLYLAGKSIPRIAALLPVSQKTLYQWAKKGDWPGRRKAHLASRRNVADILRDRLALKIAALGDNMTPSDVDEIAKISATIERLEKGAVDIRAAAVEVMERYGRYLKTLEGEDLDRQARLIQGFFQWLENQS